MAKMPDIKALSFPELTALIEHARELQESMKRETLEKLATEINEKAASMGVDLDDIIAAHKRLKRKPKGSVAAKYANPDAPSETWSGRGKMPGWLAQRVDKGAAREDFLIK